jgi:hypothetical protein
VALVTGAGRGLIELCRQAAVVNRDGQLVMQLRRLPR